MEASQHSLFDDLGDTDFLDTPISNSYIDSPSVAIESSNGIPNYHENSASVHNSTFNINNASQSFSQNSPAQSILGYDVENSLTRVSPDIRMSSSTQDAPMAAVTRDPPMAVVSQDPPMAAGSRDPSISADSLSERDSSTQPLLTRLSPEQPGSPALQSLQALKDSLAPAGLGTSLGSPAAIGSPGSLGSIGSPSSLGSTTVVGRVTSEKIQPANNKLITNLLTNQRNSPQFVKIQNNSRTNSPTPQMLVNSPNNNTQQIWQQNGTMLQQIQSLNTEPQYVMTDPNGQQWTTQLNNPIQQTIQVIQTSQGSKIIVPAGQQLVNANGQLTMLSQSTVHQNPQQTPHQVLQQTPHQILQQNPQQMIQQTPQQTPQQTSQQILQQQSPQQVLLQSGRVNPTSQGQNQGQILLQSLASQSQVQSQSQVILQPMTPQTNNSQQILLQQLASQSNNSQQNVLIRPSTSFRNTPQKVINSPIVQIKINNQLLNISMDQLKQLQNLPTKVNKPNNKTKTPKKPAKLKILSQNIDSLHEEKRILLSMSFRNTIQQARLEQLMKITIDQPLGERTLNQLPKTNIQKSIASQFLPGWQKLPIDVHQQVFLQLEDMPKEQRDLFFMNQPKILKRFEAQFQKLQKNQTTKTLPTNSMIQQIIIPSRLSPIPLKIKQSPTKSIKIKPPSKKAVASMSASISFALKQQLNRDQHMAMHPDCRTPFRNYGDVVNRLRPYHVFQTASDYPEDVIDGENMFSDICDGLIEQKNALIHKFKHLLLKDSMRHSPAPEHVMMLRRFVKDEQAQLTLDKERAVQNPDQFQPSPFLQSEEKSSTDNSEYTLSTPGEGLKIVFGKNSPAKRSLVDPEVKQCATPDIESHVIEDGDFDEPSVKRHKCNDQEMHESATSASVAGAATAAAAAAAAASLMVAPSAAITVIDSEADLAVAGLLNCVEPELEEPDEENLDLQRQQQQLAYDSWSDRMTDKALDDRFDAALAIPNADNGALLLQEMPDAPTLPSAGTNPPNDLELAIQSILG